jgi:hypothetical protein
MVMESLSQALALPTIVAHADWSANERGRSVAVARLGPDGRYRLLPPAAPGPPGGLIGRLIAYGTVLLGLDFPIGLPRRFAARAGIPSFPAFLRDVAEPVWRRFVVPAPPDVGPSLAAPFYPRRPGGAARSRFLEGLRIGYRELLRRCDLATARRPDACMTFWTLGAQQCGRAAAAGWDEVIRPALRERGDVALWPFDGRLDSLLRCHRVTIAETYPREFYPLLDPPRRWSKRRRDDRAQLAGSVTALAERVGAVPETALATALRDGLDGDHDFDALVGLLGMLAVLRGQIAQGLPQDDPAIESVEGWMLGRDGAA